MPPVQGYFKFWEFFVVSAQNDAAFLRVFLIVLGALVVFTGSIMLVASLISDELDQKRQQDSRLQAAIAERIKPIGEVKVAKAGAAPAVPKAGGQVVAEACNSCHVSGVLNAPKIGDKAAWSQRLAAGGMDGLYANAINGKGSMPPRGGAASLGDDEIRAAVKHMLAQSGVDTAGSSAAAKDAPPAAAASAPVAAPADNAKGKEIYAAACVACHLSGAAGAPKLDDKADWAKRLAQGMDALYANAINGKGAMPPKGGRVDLSDDVVKAAVDYMVEQAK